MALLPAPSTQVLNCSNDDKTFFFLYPGLVELIVGFHLSMKFSLKTYFPQYM